MAPRSGLFGNYQDPKNFIYVLCTRTGASFRCDLEINISPQQLETLLQTRTGAAVVKKAVELAQKYGWKIGDKVPIQTQTAQADGNQVWTFDIGMAIVDDRKLPRRRADGSSPIYAYLDESRVTGEGHAISPILSPHQEIPNAGGQVLAVRSTSCLQNSPVADANEL